jgi:hypothetical protein
MVEDPNWIYLLCRQLLLCEGSGLGEVICY